MASLRIDVSFLTGYKFLLVASHHNRVGMAQPGAVGTQTTDRAPTQPHLNIAATLLPSLFIAQVSLFEMWGRSGFSRNKCMKSKRRLFLLEGVITCSAALLQCFDSK